MIRIGSGACSGRFRFARGWAIASKKRFGEWRFPPRLNRTISGRTDDVEWVCIVALDGGEHTPRSMLDTPSPNWSPSDCSARSRFQFSSLSMQIGRNSVPALTGGCAVM